MDEKIINPSDYPSNNHVSRSSLDSKKDGSDHKKKPEIRPVLEKPATVKKKNWFQKSVGRIFADDFDDIKTSLISDTLIPSVRNMVFDAITNGLEMALYGSVNSKTRRSKTSYGKVNYHSSYSSIYDRKPEQRRRNSIDVDELMFDEREEAMAVLDGMIDLVEQFGVATVMDLYALSGLSTDFTDDKYGWTALGSAKVIRTKDGWLLKMPRPSPVE